MDCGQKAVVFGKPRQKRPQVRDVRAKNNLQNLQSVY
jgi:hypothetical protein